MSPRFPYRHLLAPLIALLCTAIGFAQNRPAPIESPQVHPDRTVTFLLHAPEASRVELSGQFLSGNRPMQKNEAGLWSITVGPIEPNLYPYSFVVDGVAVADPSNQDLFPNERFKASLVDIPAEPALLHAVREVPHGELTYSFYHSEKLQRVRPLVIYTPPGYREQPDRRYPVLYLVSGTTDTEETWFRAGRMNFILDNLIAEKKAVPMIVVMPYGNMMMGMPRPSTPEVAAMYQAFGDELVGQIMPFVEQNYRVVADRDHRAIAGFSRGGGQSLFTTFRHLDKFAWVASYAAYLTPEVCQLHFPETFGAQKRDPNLKLLWLGVGRSDFLFNEAVAFEKFLTEQNLQHRSLITDGGHTWMNARHYLAETLQLFFQ